VEEVNVQPVDLGRNCGKAFSEPFPVAEALVPDDTPMAGRWPG
jgi:hypothetical protein